MESEEVKKLIEEINDKENYDRGDFVFNFADEIEDGRPYRYKGHVFKKVEVNNGDKIPRLQRNGLADDYVLFTVNDELFIIYGIYFKQSFSFMEEIDTVSKLKKTEEIMTEKTVRNNYERI